MLLNTLQTTEEVMVRPTHPFLPLAPMTPLLVKLKRNEGLKRLESPKRNEELKRLESPKRNERLKRRAWLKRLVRLKRRGNSKKKIVAEGKRKKRKINSLANVRSKWPT